MDVDISCEDAGFCKGCGYMMCRCEVIMNAMETEQSWKDYGRANRNCPNKAEAFTMLWANLHRHHPEYSHHDRERFLGIFMEAASGTRFWTCRKCGTAELVSAGATHCPGCGAEIPKEKQ